MADAKTQSGPAGPAEGNGARLTFRDMKLAILTLLDREGPLAQAELVASGLERHFARAFGPRERALAEESWSQLLHDGLIAEDAPGRAGLRGSGGLTGPVGLTGVGAAALEKVALDPLDLGLARLAPRLVELRAAAWAAVAGESEMALRAVAQAPREIVDSVLAAAPASPVAVPVSPVAVAARDLVHAVDAAMAARLARGQAPTAQMMADAIRSAEIVIRETLTGGYEHDR